ncbi:MAG: peptidylprolyl isomerase [Desulfobacteraceae bacterium]|nr:peptidylprolyl isomerase [Desulfobacteraceae bacterium]
MRNFKVFLYLFPLMVNGFTGDISFSAEIRNRVVAIVNTELITLYELNNRMKEMTGYEPSDLKAMSEQRYIETRREIVDLMIDEKIELEKIRELGINVTDKKVDAAIERIKKDNHLTHEDLIAQLKEDGLTYEKYKANIKSDLERAELINFEVKSKIILREETIKAYYYEHKEQFRTTEKVHLAVIVLIQKDPSNQDEARSLNRKAEEILTRVKNGEDFGELARQFSQGPGASEGGDMGFFKDSELNPKLREVVREMSSGEVSEPIIIPNGMQIIRVLEKHGGGIRPFEDVKDAIQGILFREELNKRYSAWIKELRETAYTKIIF